MQHHAVLASAEFKGEHYPRIRAWIESLPPHERTQFLEVEAQANGVITLILPPDGSKEGWAESDAGDDLRDRFIAELHKDENEDGENPWQFAEIQYGELGIGIRSRF